MKNGVILSKQLQIEWSTHTRKALASKKPKRNCAAEIDLLTKQINNHPADWLLYVMRSYLYGADDNPNVDYHACIDDCLKIISLRGDQFSAWKSTNVNHYYLMASCWYYLREYTKVIEVCSAGVGMEPKAHLFRLRGCAHSAIGQLEMAVEDLTRAVDFPHYGNFIYHQAIRDRNKVIRQIRCIRSGKFKDKPLVLNWPR